MALGEDFLSLLEILKQQDGFSFWNTKNHAALAYVLHFAHTYPEYEEALVRWKKMATDLNAFCWEMAQGVVSFSQKDPRVPPSEVARIQGFVNWYAEDYKNGDLQQFALVSDEYTPDWFFLMLPNYMKLAEMQQEIAIKEHCQEQGMTLEESCVQFEAFQQCYDLRNEFHQYLQRGQFPQRNPLMQEGETAQTLVETRGCTPLEAYQIMIKQREESR